MKNYANGHMTHQSSILQVDGNVLRVVSVDVVIINWAKSLESSLGSHPGGNFQPVHEKNGSQFVVKVLCTITKLCPTTTDVMYLYVRISYV